MRGPSAAGDTVEEKKIKQPITSLGESHRFVFFLASSFIRFPALFPLLSPSTLMAAAAVTARRPTDKAMGGGGCAGGGAEGAGAALPSAPPVSARATSASGLLALLAEPEPELVGAALRGLDAAVPQFWFEIAQSIGALEAVAEDEASPHRELASLVASKVIDGGERNRWRKQKKKALKRRSGAAVCFCCFSQSQSTQRM